MPRQLKVDKFFKGRPSSSSPNHILEPDQPIEQETKAKGIFRKRSPADSKSPDKDEKKAQMKKTALYMLQARKKE